MKSESSADSNQLQSMRQFSWLYPSFGRLFVAILRWRFSWSSQLLILKHQGTLSIFRSNLHRWRFSESFAPILPFSSKSIRVSPDFIHLSVSFVEPASTRKVQWVSPILASGFPLLSWLLFGNWNTVDPVSPDFIHLSGVFCWTCIYY